MGLFLTILIVAVVVLLVMLMCKCCKSQTQRDQDIEETKQKTIRSVCGKELWKTTFATQGCHHEAHPSILQL